jgi:hypothetical protein
MDPRVEEILMARAIKDASEVPTSGEAFVTGAIPGAIVGTVAGQIPHSILKNTTGRLLNRNSGVRPGARMAGGLVGAILGGGLGMGTRQMMIDNSPAATLLARGQAEGGLSASDQKILADILTDTYQQMGLR